MIAQRMSGLLSASLLVGLSLIGSTHSSAQQQSGHASATHHPTASAVVSSCSHSGGGSPGGAPEDCCHLIGSCSSLPIDTNSRGINQLVGAAQRIATKDFLKPATLALGVDTPPPKA